jgi:hypothetical protein
MRLRVALFGTIGAVATGFGLLILVAPDLVRGAGPIGSVLDAVVTVDQRLVMLVTGLIVGGSLVVTARSRQDPEGRSDSTAEMRFETGKPPEAVTADRRTVAASHVDDALEGAIQQGGPRLQETRLHLSTAAAGAYAAATGSSSEVARAAVASGEWTRDPVAAMFLATDGGPEPDVRSRLALWLVPRRERRRRIERTIAAIERLGEP